MGSEVRVRFAPSPTGFLHIGGARTALFNWLFARHHGGTFILRIEDTDQARHNEEAAAAILEGMTWLGMTWDEGPIYQSDRFGIHAEAARALLAKGLAYECFCSPETLETIRKERVARGASPGYDGRCGRLTEAERAAKRAEIASAPTGPGPAGSGGGSGATIRFRVPPGPVVVPDLVHGAMTFEASTLDDFIILKSSGTPVYNFSVAVDDAAMGITHVIRGDDHISNTPKQILLLRAMGKAVPEYAHMPMILGADKAKLSKRHGAVSVTAYRDLGFLPEAMVNYLSLLGWSFDDKTELFSVADLIEKFSLDRVGSHPAVFDVEKLTWMNGVYLRNLDKTARTRVVSEFLARENATRTGGDQPAAPPPDPDWLERVVVAIGDRLKTTRDLFTYAGFLFVETPEMADDAAKKLADPDARAALVAARAVVAAAEPFDPATLEAGCRAAAAAAGISFGKMVHPVRAALTGKTVSPGLFDVIALLGRDRSLSRLDAAIARADGRAPTGAARAASGGDAP